MSLHSITVSSTIVRSSQFITTPMDNELAMMSLESNAYFGLDEIGAVIWEALEQPKTVGALCDELLARYDIDRAQCQADVIDFLTDLHEAKIVELVEEKSG